MGNRKNHLNRLVDELNEMNLQFYGIPIVFDRGIILDGVDKIGSEREKEVLLLYRDGYSLREIGEIIGVSCSRVQQNLRNLKQKLKSKWMLYYTISIADADKLINRELNIQAVKNIKNDKLNNSKSKKEYSITDFIRSANLSVRTSNCIIRSGVKTVRELIDLTPDDVMKWRNLGNKSYIELEKALRRIGLSFSEKDDVQKPKAIKTKKDHLNLGELKWNS